jgi:hypothetical protein
MYNQIINQHKMASLTIVTAFFSGINIRNDRDISDYINLGCNLLKIPLSKLVFIDRNIFKEYFNNSSIPVLINLETQQSKSVVFYKSCIFPTTHFYLIDFKDIYLFNYINNVEKFTIITPNPEKNTIKYIMIQCMKTDWVRQAIEMNIYNTLQFAWVDFGAFHFIKDYSVFEKGLFHISTCEYNTHVRIACGKPPDFSYFSKNVYHYIIWLFLGSVFGGGKEPLLKFAKLVKDKCESIIKKKHHLMWELNVWYLIFFENIHLFSRYIAKHDSSMFNNY